jgi:hypothetical protein
VRSTVVISSLAPLGQVADRCETYDTSIRPLRRSSEVRSNARNGHIADRQVMAENGMAAFQTEIVESCRSLRVDPAGLFRAVSLNGHQGNVCAISAEGAARGAHPIAELSCGGALLASSVLDAPAWEDQAPSLSGS